MKRSVLWWDLGAPLLALVALGIWSLAGRMTPVGRATIGTVLLTVLLLVLVLPRLGGAGRFGALVLLGTTLVVVWGTTAWLLLSRSAVPLWLHGLFTLLALVGGFGELRLRVRAIVRKGAAQEAFE